MILPNDLDRRETLARPDLAARDLEGVVRAARFAAPVRMQVSVPVAGVHVAPNRAAEQDDQALFGELIDVMEVKDGWAWGQARRDGYVGYICALGLQAEVTTPTHWVRALRAFAFAEPSLKSRAIGPFSLNALVSIEDEDGAFLHAAGVGWFPARHLAAIGIFEPDYVSVAERFIGAPYLWGGRDSIGVDCSGLVQQALLACGRACPRDADLQAQLGEPAPRNRLARGDLVFWRDHVGIMLDAERLLHANGFHAATVVEPLTDAIARNAAGGAGEPIAYRRLTP